MRDLGATEIARLERLAESLDHPSDLDAAIHATRKGIKRIRAYLRLARRSIGTAAYRAENAALRRTARTLAPARDAFVLVDTAEALDASGLIIAQLAASHREAISALEIEGRADAAQRLADTAARWRDFGWNGPDAKSIGSGLLRTYRRGLVDLETVRAVGTDQSFHGWRRRAKYLRYQLEVLRAPAEIVAGYTALGDALGLEHDHTVLLGVCSNRGDRADWAELSHQSERRREELRATALKTGADLFAREPESFRLLIEESISLR